MSTKLSLLAPSPIPRDVALAVVSRLSPYRKADLIDYVNGLWDYCPKVGLNAATMMAHSANETKTWTSLWWQTDLNPVGLGIMDGGALQKRVYTTGTEAAKAHIYHQFLYVYGIPPSNHMIAGWKPLDPRADAVAEKGYLQSAVYLDDMQGTWWTLPAGTQGTYDKYKALFGSLDAGGPAMALAINSDRLLTGGANYPGSNLNSGDLWITIHDTGNPNVGADAKMHHGFVLSGGGQYNVSFQLTVDDHIAYQIMQLDKVAYHAGDGCDNRTTDLGCFASVAIESCINSDGNFNQMIENLIDLCVAIISGDSRLKFGTAKGRFSADRITTHNNWADDGKWCPRTILNAGLMPYIRSEVKRRLAGVSPTPSEPTQPIYATPSVPVFLKDQDALDRGDDQVIGDVKVYYCRRQYRARRGTPRLRNAAAGSPEVGPPIKKNERFIGLFRFKFEDKWWVLTAAGTRVQASHLDPYITITEKE